MWALSPNAYRFMHHRNPMEWSFMRNESPIHRSTQMSVNFDGELCPIIGRFFLTDLAAAALEPNLSGSTCQLQDEAPIRRVHMRSPSYPLASGHCLSQSALRPQPCPPRHPPLPTSSRLFCLSHQNPNGRTLTHHEFLLFSRFETSQIIIFLYVAIH